MWGTSLGEDKFGARARILTTKVVHRASAAQTSPPPHPPPAGSLGPPTSDKEGSGEDVQWESLIRLGLLSQGVGRRTGTTIPPCPPLDGEKREEGTLP